jgi:hypothetical protein
VEEATANKAANMEMEAKRNVKGESWGNEYQDKESNPGLCGKTTAEEHELH